VEDELKAVADGNPVARSVAATMIDSINGNPSDDFVACIVTAAACVEWDVDADGAWDRVREALELLAGTSSEASPMPGWPSSRPH
jgi:hypothetical protein